MPTDKRARQKEGRRLRQEEQERWERRTRFRRRTITFVVLGVVVIGGLALLSALQDDEEAATSAEGCPPAGGVAEPVRSFTEPPPTCIDPARSYTAVFDTSEGEIRVALDTQNTPDTVNNFVFLARNRYYDGTPIFRTDPSIGIIQGGGQGADDPGPGYTIPDEGDGFTYAPGQLVMARQEAPNSAGAQWFFVANDSASALDAQGTYVVFGETDGPGLRVVRRILGLHEDQPENPLGGAPRREVTVRSVTIEES
jgi:cyclophilin family peptidyl-prolyl cis-trans isomerase